MIEIGNPQPTFIDARGALSDGGYIYVGVANGDPETNPINVYWDSGLTQLASQPLRTVGGHVVNGAIPSRVFTAGTDYSMRLRDSDGSQVFYSPSVFNPGNAYQPIDSDLTAIAALGTTPFGRSLLTLANQAALAAATGIPNPLPLTGGNVTGTIGRQGAGSYTYFVDGSLTSGRIFVTANGAGDPTSQPGDLWLQKQ